MRTLKPFPQRWWYAAPWKTTRPYLPKVKFYLCGDEYCNDTLYLVVPLLGSFVFRINRNIRLSGRCDECVEEFGPWCPGCENCHRGPRCHNWNDCIIRDTGHESKLLDCSGCGGAYCPECERTPEGSCPSKGGVK